VEIFEVLVTGIALACPAGYSGVLWCPFSIDFAFLEGALKGVPSDQKGDNTALATAVAVGVSSLYGVVEHDTVNPESQKQALRTRGRFYSLRERGLFYIFNLIFARSTMLFGGSSAFAGNAFCALIVQSFEDLHRSPYILRGSWPAGSKMVAGCDT
jgi:hypothetical protein